MAWPFGSVNEPNFNTGPGAAVPLGYTSIAVGVTWLMGLHLTNTDTVSRTVTLVDGSSAVVAEFTMPGGAEQVYEWAFRPVTGLKWIATGAGVVGQIWGYQ